MMVKCADWVKDRLHTQVVEDQHLLSSENHVVELFGW